MRLSYGRRNLQINTNYNRSFYIVFQTNFVGKLVMAGRITSNKFLSGYQNAALMEDDKETSQNTLFANILADRGVQEVFLNKVH